MEQADGIAATADRRDQQVGQAAGAGEHLGAGFLADHALKIADQFRIGVRPGSGADDVEGVVHIGDPVAQRLVHRVLQRCGASRDRDHFRAEQLHAEHVGRLSRHVSRAHIDHAGQAEAGADRGRGHAVLARAGFGDDPGLAHADRQQDLADAIVDLVRAGVVQLVPLEPDLCPLPGQGILAQLFGQARREIERAGPADIVFKQVVELGLESRIGLGRVIFALKVQDQRHQRFGDIATAELSEVAAFVRLVAKGIRCRVCSHDGLALGRAGPRSPALPQRQKGKQVVTRIQLLVT